MTAPLARILLRYLSAVLITKGLLAQEISYELHAPEVVAFVEVSIGMAIAAVTEGYYWAARRFGWQT